MSEKKTVRRWIGVLTPSRSKKKVVSRLKSMTPDPRDDDLSREWSISTPTERDLERQRWWRIPNVRWKRQSACSSRRRAPWPGESRCRDFREVHRVKCARGRSPGRLLTFPGSSAVTTTTTMMMPYGFQLWRYLLCLSWQRVRVPFAVTEIQNDSHFQLHLLLLLLLWLLSLISLLCQAPTPFLLLEPM